MRESGVSSDCGAEDEAGLVDAGRFHALGAFPQFWVKKESAF
jgi:hypothetical protein